MTPEQIKKMQDDIATLMAFKESLERSNTIPLDIDQAFRGRLMALQATGTGTASTQSIVLTGNPQTITVPAQPSGVVTVTVSGITYQLLYK